MPEPVAYFITFTTYGTWLPGDLRGWRKHHVGDQQPRPLLEAWVRDLLKDEPLLLDREQRSRVEQVCRQHATVRGWSLHAVSARSNHVHLVVTTNTDPKLVRDQFKANATRVLRQQPGAIAHKRVWTRGGDIDFVDSDDDLEQVIIYVTMAQDRMDRGK